MDVQLTKLQQLHNNLISIFFRIPKECFQHLVKSICHKELRHFWRQLGVQTSTRKVCLVSVQTINKAVIWSVEFCWSVFRFLYSRQICRLVHWNAQVRWRSKDELLTLTFEVCTLLNLLFACFAFANLHGHCSLRWTANQSNLSHWLPNSDSTCSIGQKATNEFQHVVTVHILTHHKKMKNAQQRPDIGQLRTVNLVCQGLYMTKTSEMISAVASILHCTERLEEEFITVDNPPGLIFQTSDG